MSGVVGLSQADEGQVGEVHAVCQFQRDDVDTAVRWARDQTDGWGVPPSYVAHWLVTAGGMLPTAATARAELSYDVGLGLLSLDVWDGDARVYGMDDWVS